MNMFYSDIINHVECLMISSQMLEFSNSHKTQLENQSAGQGNCEGYFNLPSTLLVLPKIQQKIKQDYNKNIVFKNTYSRIYRNGSSLRCHTDRPGLDITLSLCVHNNTTVPWPLRVSRKHIDTLWDDKYAEDHMSDYDEYHTPVGCAAACLGTKAPHWREILKCHENSMMIQCFFHWQILD